MCHFSNKNFEIFDIFQMDYPCPCFPCPDFCGTDLIKNLNIHHTISI